MLDFDLCVMDWGEDVVFLVSFTLIGFLIGRLLVIAAGAVKVDRHTKTSLGNFGFGCLLPIPLSILAFVGFFRLFDFKDDCGGAFTPDSVGLGLLWLVMPIVACLTYLFSILRTN